jgi:hypothetical protein
MAVMLSVVITTYRDELGCYLTAFSVKAQLEAQNLSHEIIVVADGGTEQKWENAGIRCLRGSFGSPQASRDAGIRAARSNDVLVLESHVIVSDIGLLLAQHRGLGGALTFPRRVAEGPEMFDVHGHETDWEGNLWYKRLVYQPFQNSPYRVAQFGNSCFIADRDWYVGTGGYTDLLAGWGGEESFLCLKVWMLGRECWLVPGVWHAHYLTPGAHDAEILDGGNDRNFRVAGYVLDGRDPGFPVTDAMRAERARICAGPMGGGINRLRSHLQDIGAVS